MIATLFQNVGMELLMQINTNSNTEKIEQLNLLTDESTESILQSKDTAPAFSDPAFAKNKTLPIHRWVPWIAGFASDFVRDAIQRHLNSHGTVLDPFAGVGTTLIEAILAGHNAVGFEINPYAALACRIKANAYQYDVTLLKDELQRLRNFCSEKTDSSYIPSSSVPSGFKTRADFYSPLVLRKVLLVHDFIATIKDTYLQEIFKLAFASTMVLYSNYSYEPSLSQRVSSGKPIIYDFPVAQTISSKLIEMIDDIVWLQSRLHNSTLSTSIINDSFFNYATQLKPLVADLIITSPPYMNNYHYNRNTRPQLYWLGYVEKPKDFELLETSNVGKYWQTVRDLKYVGLDFSLPDTDIDERLQEIRDMHPEKKQYGGNGWANYAASYFNDCYRFAKGIDYALKPEGTALVVIGNSILQGVSISTDQYFGKIAESIGLELVDIHIPRATRTGNSIIQSNVRVEKAKDSHQLYEAIVELRKKRGM